MNKITAAVAVAVLVTVAARAQAGMKTTNEVTVSTAGRSAQGSLSAARNSADTTQYIGCGVETREDSQTAYCSAVSASTARGYCTTTSEKLIQAVGTVKGDSYIQFNWDETNHCTYIYVSQYSVVEPKR